MMSKGDRLTIVCNSIVAECVKSLPYLVHLSNGNLKPRSCLIVCMLVISCTDISPCGLSSVSVSVCVTPLPCRVCECVCFPR